LASTYTPNDAVTLVRNFIRNAPLAALDHEIVDLIHSTIWTHYPWKWVQASLTAITCVDGTQDYTIDAGDTDVRKVLRVRLVRTSDTPDTYIDLDRRDWLAPDLMATGAGGMSLFAEEPVTGKIRLERAISLGTGETVQIQGEYWKDPIKITNSELGDAFAFPDQFYSVFVEGLKWQAYAFLDDSRAGSVQTQKNGGTVYTGQLGVFRTMLDDMAMAEDYANHGGEFPASPIGERMSVWGGWPYR
jgi:hypothetical protein